MHISVRMCKAEMARLWLKSQYNTHHKGIHRCFVFDRLLGNLRDSYSVKNRASSKRRLMYYVILPHATRQAGACATSFNATKVRYFF